MHKYEDREMKIEKIWHLKATTMPVIVRALGMIKEGRDKHIKKILRSCSQYQMQWKLLFLELLISLGENC